jgi:phosphoglycerate dehydrogenase-like enzyme
LFIGFSLNALYTLSILIEVQPMAKMIVFVHQLSPHHIEQIQTVAPAWDVIHGKDHSLWLPHLKEAEIIAGWNHQVEKECLDRENAQLRWIQNWGAGVDSLPLHKFRARGVIVTNPAEFTPTLSPRRSLP